MPAAGDLVIFPDVEALVVQTLNGDGRTGVAWATQVPNPRPTEFGRVFRFGGPKQTLVSEGAQIALEAWAQTESRAVTILNLGRAILNAQDGTLFGVSELSGPSNLPDPTTSQVRYTQNLIVRVRGSILA